MNLSKASAFLSIFAFAYSTRAAVTFSEDFSSGKGSNLIVTGGSETTIDFAGGSANFTGLDSSGATRAYLGTSATFDLAVAFTAEVDVIVPNGSGGNGLAFFGFGTGQRGDSSQGGGAPSFYEPSVGPTAYIALLPNDFNLAGIASADFAGSVMGGLSAPIPGAGPVGSGSHKLQMIYNPSNSSLQFAYKKQGATGAGDPWQVATSINISDNNFTNANGRVFFGGSGAVTFDNLNLVVVPEVSTMTLVALFSCVTLVRRKR